MKTISSRDFNRDTGAAKRAAAKEPVFVTDRGKPTHVLLSVDAYLQIAGENKSLLDAAQLLNRTCPLPVELLDWEPPKLDIQTRAANFD